MNNKITPLNTWNEYASAKRVLADLNDRLRDAVPMSAKDAAFLEELRGRIIAWDKSHVVAFAKSVNGINEDSESQMIMWSNNENPENKKGLLGILNSPANIIHLPSPSSYTFEDMGRDLQLIMERDVERRAFLDTQYTPISDITDKEIEDAARPYGDNIPTGLLVKARIGGQYIETPLKLLVAMKDAVKRMREKQNNEQGVQECDATDDDSGNKS